MPGWVILFGQAAHDHLHGVGGDGAWRCRWEMMDQLECGSHIHVKDFSSSTFPLVGDPSKGYKNEIVS
jgi:hypothetical protein